MKNVIFENDGEIDLRSISTFGLNVKETNNPIGFFGTGLKYALAVLLRTGQKVEIQSGNKTFRVGTTKDLVRGKEFEFAYIDGPDADHFPLGFTTELGKNWEDWMAYRELYCNTLDEKGEVRVEESIPDAKAGKTKVIVSGDKFLSAHQNRGDFLLEDRPDFKIGSIEVRYKPSQNFFYRGMKVMQFQRPAMYTYNETAPIDLTEDRTVKEPFHALYSIARNILSHADRPMLNRVLMADEKNIEHCFDYHGWGGCAVGAEFFPAVSALQRESLTKINQTALRLWRDQAGGFCDPRRIKPTKVQIVTLNRAIQFCDQIGFMLKDEYPIFIVETLGGDGVLAMADKIGKQIFLTERLFQSGGTKMVARALIEEYLHLKHGFSDDSREMQNYLFDKVISMAEEIRGEPI